jgi:nucleoside-diphosphate-sugar epimerase
MHDGRLFVLGATGFIGSEVVAEAVARGWRVKALVRSPAKAGRIRALGAIAVPGDARGPGEWIHEVRGADVLVDLTQPELPGRIGARRIEAVAAKRRETTAALLRHLATIPLPERPVLFSVSGTDDLQPDAGGRIDGGSPLRSSPTGFGHVGVPVRRMVEASGTPAAFLHLGTVYGPGKSFARTILPALERGRMLLPRKAANRLPLVHVRDAARAIVHLASLGGDRTAGRSWIVVDVAGGARLGEFLDRAAELMGVRPPRRVPAGLISALLGRILLETLTRDLHADPGDLVATGFTFEYPTVAEGLPATLGALGYPRPPRLARPGRRLPVLLAAAIAALVAVNSLDHPLAVPGIRKLAAGEQLLDLRPGYSPGDAARFLGALGRAGRTRYVEMLWTVDLVLPALFAAALWTAIRAGALRRWRWLAIAAGAADYLENLAITSLAVAYPRLDGRIAWVAGTVTAAKLALYLASSALALAGGWRVVRSRRMMARPVGPEVP